MDTTELWQRVEAATMELYALALDALIDQGVEATEEQYRLALIEAGRRGKTSIPHTYFPQAREAAVVSHIAWTKSLYKIEKADDDD